MTYQILDEPEKDPSTDVVASLADEYGGRVRIVIDDHCFVLQHFIEPAHPEDHPPYWKPVTHWFPEALLALDAVRGRSRGLG